MSIILFGLCTIGIDIGLTVVWSEDCESEPLMEISSLESSFESVSKFSTCLSLYSVSVCSILVWSTCK